MPKQKAEPRLRKRKARYNSKGKLTHRGSWYIQYGDQQVATGCSFGSHQEAALAYEEAKKKLHEFNVARFIEDVPSSVPSMSTVLIGDLLRHYLEAKASEIAKKPTHRRRALLSEIECLDKFWGEKHVNQINSRNSLLYQEGKKVSVVRNKLILLRAVVNFCALHQKVRKNNEELNYNIPPRLYSRLHHYSVEEAITLYKAARRRRHSQYGKPDFRCATHIARFMLVAIMTGTRSSRICSASFVKEEGRPWVDLESGIFYREAEGEMAPHNKRAKPIRIPDRLLNLMKIWHRGTRAIPATRYLIEYGGRPVDCRKGFYTLKRQVFSEKRAAELNRHSFKHTCVTWLVEDGVPIEDIAEFLSTTPAILREVYSHLLPGSSPKINDAFSRKRPRKLRPERSQQRRTG